MDVSPIRRDRDARNEGPAAVEFALVDSVIQTVTMAGRDWWTRPPGAVDQFDRCDSMALTAVLNSVAIALVMSPSVVTAK